MKRASRSNALCHEQRIVSVAAGCVYCDVPRLQHLRPHALCCCRQPSAVCCKQLHESRGRIVFSFTLKVHRLLLLLLLLLLIIR